MRRLVLVFFLLICLPFSVNAEEKSIELTGERLTYHGDGEEIIAINGKLIYQDVVLEGQKIHIFLQKKQLEAFGDVVVTENKEQFHASQANFNWDTDSWEFFDASSEFTGRSIVGKVFFRGKNLTREPDLTTVDESFMTSCDLEKPHYHIDAQKIEIIPDKRVILHGISYWDFGFKIFTLPYYVIFLDRKEQLPFIPIIGQSSSYGFYVNLFSIISLTMIPMEQYISTGTKKMVGESEFAIISNIRIPTKKANFISTIEIQVNLRVHSKPIFNTRKNLTNIPT
jgi:lipopolysaccharide assembly outer membrane protein LptD (OstA)